MTILLLLTSVWSMLFAGLQDKQPSMVIPPMDMPLCSPAIVPIDNYLFSFPATDTVVKLPLEYYDILLCNIQSANLLLLPSSVTSEPISATICSGESYTWNGKTYSKPGTYTDTLTNIHGCDSIVTLHLTILPAAVTETESVTIGSDQLPYTWRGQSLTATGQYTAAEQYMATACDSLIHVLDLTVLSTGATDEQTVTICDTELPYQWYNQDYTATGIYTYIEKYVGTDIDSVQHILHLTVNPTVRTEETVTACDSYTWNGQTYATTGAYTYTTTAANGCDSIVTLYLTINQSEVGTTEYATICYGETYTWNGQTYSTEGEYSVTLTNTLGCDSTATLVLTIMPEAITETESVTIGSDQLPYLWRGQSLTATGQYTDIEQYTAADCDSAIHVLNLTVLSTGATDEQTVSICDTELPYQWYNQDYSTTGTYTHIEKYVGTDIDSVQHILHLTVNPTIRTEETITACDSYTWNGQTYTQTGAYTYTTTAANGCDSIVTLHLTINQSEVGTTEYATICYGESYTWNGNTYNTSDTYTVTLTNQQGCDSTATLLLTIMPEAVTETESVTVGSDELPYIWRGQSLTATGQYTDIEPYTTAACDSAIHVLNLTVLSTGATDEQTVVICDTDLPYQWYNQVCTASGQYTHIEKYVGTDIDSVQHILHLTVNPTIRTEETITACDSYTWNGQTYATTGAYTYTTTAANGCDSIVTLHLTINQSEVGTTEYATICYGETYTWNGNTYDTSDTYTVTLTNQQGCDSTATLVLTIMPEAITTTETVVIGSDELPYIWRGQSLNATGQYTAAEQYMATACDSVIHVLDLTVLSTGATDEQTVTICDTELPYQWYNQDYTATGIYTYIEKYVGTDIDSVQHILHLTVNPTIRTEETITACDSYTWNGQTYATTGAYTYTTTAANGCDSIVTLHLTINQSEVGTTEYATICYGETYTWNGQTYSAEGEYSLTLTNTLGCDSTATLLLTIMPEAITETESVTIGSDQLPYLWRGQSLTATGQYTDIEQYTAADCDSAIHVLNLTVLSTGATDEQTVVICDTDLPYQWYNQVCTASGQYTYSEQYAGTDIDSIQHILTLTIHSGIEVPYSVTTCDSYTWSNGMTYTASGVYYDSLHTIHGCDSVEILILTINYRDTAFFSQTACETYTWYGTEYQESGTYYYHTQTALGCDSVEVLYLTILPPTAYIVADTLLCYGATCDWRGLQLTTAGSYNDTLKNQLDCDSIIYTLHIDYLPDVQHLITDTSLCYGEVCDWRGMVYERSGTYLDNVKNVLGCDSIIYTLNLVIYPEIPITHVIDTMAGPEYHWNEQIYTHGGNYTVTLPAMTGCDSVVNLHLVDNPAAIDTVLVYEQCAGTGEQEVEILTQGFIEQIVLNYAPQLQEAGLRDTVMPYTASNTYTIQYDSVRAGVHEVTTVALFHGVEVATYTFALNYLYPNTIFEQRYNDLIAILTHDYNGGYDFAAFQWYKDGVLLPGETHSYLNQPLSFESEYSVLLTNTEGLQLMSCSFTPESKSDLSVYPTFVKEGSPVICRTTEPLQLGVYHVSGVLLYEQDLSVGRNEIYLPAVSGVYLLLFKAENHIERNMKVIVQ